jgi:hypothetical protein
MSTAKTAILTCVLGGFDTLHDPVEQDTPVDFHRWTDDNFPPIMGLTPRLQYRIPKLFGWDMYPGYDHYIWLDGTASFLRQDCATWYLSQLDDNDIALFKHPTRQNARQEVEHIEEHLRLGKPYISARYKNGLHREQLDEMFKDPTFKDDKLYASTTFIYKNTPKVHEFMKDWWYHQSRYFTCDQVVIPYLFHKHKINVKEFDEPIYKTGYMSLVSHHK